MRAISPALAWDDNTYLLARMDYILRVIAWMFSEDGSKGVNKPEPVATPVQLAEAKKKQEETESYIDFVHTAMEAGISSQMINHVTSGGE